MMIYDFNTGKKLDENSMQDQFDALLDNDGSAVGICGMTFYPSVILRECDPTAYRSYFLNFVDFQLRRGAWVKQLRYIRVASVNDWELANELRENGDILDFEDDFVARVDCLWSGDIAEYGDSTNTIPSYGDDKIYGLGQYEVIVSALGNIVVYVDTLGANGNDHRRAASYFRSAPAATPEEFAAEVN